MTAQEYKAPESVGRLQNSAFMVGGVALLIAIFFWVKSPDAFYRSYLTSYLLILGFALGSLGLLMLQHLTGGHWGIMIRRPLEAASRTLPLIALLFIPILFGMPTLYFRWLDPAIVQQKPLSDFQQHYLITHGVLGFYGRLAIYFLIWLGLMWRFNAWSREQDVNREDRSLRRRLKMLAGPGIILYVFAMSFAAIDWVMSITPHWASTIYGFLFVAGQAISSMALMIAMIVLLSRSEPYASILQKRHLHDLGKLLFAFNMLWAYFGFSQLLIIWSGNQPEEITFYHTRFDNGWGVVAVIVLVFHFFVPFFILLSQDIKKNAGLLSKIAIWMILMRLVDLFWVTRPELTPEGQAVLSPIPAVTDIVLPIALVGIWLGFFAWNLKREPLLPLGDPKLAEAIGRHEH